MKDSEHKDVNFKHIRIERTIKIDLTPVLSLDFDGVLCDGDFVDEKTIIGNPVMTNLGCNAIVYIRKMHKEDIPMGVYSCRSANPNGIQLMKKWLRDNGLEEEIIHSIGFPTHKPHGIYIDDNCVQALKYGVYFPTVEEVKNWLAEKKKC